MEKHRRHLLIASLITAIVTILYFAQLIQWIVTAVLLLLIFPYLSFSLFFTFIKTPKEDVAIDIMKRRYST
ncbi:MAG: hypothetical protein DRN29_03560 [Thermoplasmata archaeon]|nr:MAG: hypothetical protein DRN29_03560 [Thermoplasmata archaeon]